MHIYLLILLIASCLRAEIFEKYENSTLKSLQNYNAENLAPEFPYFIYPNSNEIFSAAQDIQFYIQSPSSPTTGFIVNCDCQYPDAPSPSQSMTIPANTVGVFSAADFENHDGQCRLQSSFGGQTFDVTFSVRQTSDFPSFSIPNVGVTFPATSAVPYEITPPADNPTATYTVRFECNYVTGAGVVAMQPNVHANQPTTFPPFTTNANGACRIISSYNNIQFQVLFNVQQVGTATATFLYPTAGEVISTLQPIPFYIQLTPGAVASFTVTLLCTYHDSSTEFASLTSVSPNVPHEFPPFSGKNADASCRIQSTLQGVGFGVNFLLKGTVVTPMGSFAFEISGEDAIQVIQRII